MSIIDRILTIIITATLTSAVWIIAGGSLIKLAEDQTGEASMRPAEAQPSPEPSPTDGATARASNDTDLAKSDPVALDTDGSSSSESAPPGVLRIPVLNVRAADLSDTFLDERGGGNRLHEALDIMAPVGTSIVAAAPGTIERLFFSEAGGNTIYVRSTDRKTIHYYAHLDEYAEGLKEGQRIRRGQRLGTVGHSGNAEKDAPHLHFAILRTTADAEWWEPANAVNPYPLLVGR
ncbi:Peptidase family M23 [Altererythrobacter xiamenensis]|uniref:Peptidase family M23 n=1 Tax=Altererythrobacter xiamenensis TaxID=1316679 RepID=A0A1Y6FHY9_9SPHN|nr:M23 family metallopeptidase [Altererythrobacter xiamenensis]SMQ74329.1 Peptidase family M23 [Altererythrobacter xiamenensis]